MTSQLNYMVVQQKMNDLARASERAHLVSDARDAHDRGRFSRLVDRVRLRRAGAGRSARVFQDVVADAPQPRR